MHLWFPKYTFSNEKEGCPMQLPKIIYFCKFKLERTWNYAYLVCKIHNFLRQGGAALLQPPKLYIYINFGPRFYPLYYTNFVHIVWEYELLYITCLGYQNTSYFFRCKRTVHYNSTPYLEKISGLKYLGLYLVHYSNYLFAIFARFL